MAYSKELHDEKARRRSIDVLRLRDNCQLSFKQMGIEMEVSQERARQLYVDAVKARNEGNL